MPHHAPHPSSFTKGGHKVWGVQIQTAVLGHCRAGDPWIWKVHWSMWMVSKSTGSIRKDIHGSLQLKSQVVWCLYPGLENRDGTVDHGWIVCFQELCHLFFGWCKLVKIKATRHSHQLREYCEFSMFFFVCKKLQKLILSTTMVNSPDIVLFLMFLVGKWIHLNRVGSTKLLTIEDIEDGVSWYKNMTSHYFEMLSYLGCRVKWQLLGIIHQQHARFVPHNPDGAIEDALQVIWNILPTIFLDCFLYHKVMDFFDSQAERTSPSSIIHHPSSIIIHHHSSSSNIHRPTSNIA